MVDSPNILDPNALTGPETPEETARLNDPGWLDYIKKVGGDIIPSIASGLELNVSSYPGAVGDIEQLVNAGQVLSNKYISGASPEELDAQRKALEEARLAPTTGEVRNAVTRHPYTPTTGPGQLLETVASIAGPRAITGGVKHLARDVIAPIIGGEAGGFIGSLFGPEEAQVLAAGGGMAAGPAEEYGKRRLTSAFRGPSDVTPASSMPDFQGNIVQLTPETPNERNMRMQRLAAEGIDVTGGQAFGSEMIKRLEAGPYNTKGGQINESQARQITRAVLKRAGINTDLLTPEIADAAQQQFGRNYEELIRQNNGIVMDNTLANRLQDIGVNFEDLKGSASGTAVEKFFNRIVDTAHQHGGTIPPDVFNQIHSELSAAIKSASKAPELSVMASSLRDMEDALYDTMGRNGQPDVQARAQDLNNKYRNFKIAEASVGGAGEKVSFGLVSPGKLRAELERRDKSGYARGQGDLSQLARDLQSLTDLPASGTGAQLASSGLSGVATTALFNAPLSGVLTSHPVRTSLVKRGSGINPGFIDPMQMPPILGLSGQVMKTLPMPAPVDVPESPADKPDQQSMLQGGDYPVPVDLTNPADILRRRGLSYG